MSDNTVTICGNLTADPKMKVTNGGISKTLLLVAVDRHWFHNGEWRKDRDFLRVVTFDRMAEHCADSLSTGDRVIATGRINHRQYTNGDGTETHAYEVVASEVGFSLRFNGLTDLDNQE